MSEKTRFSKKDTIDKPLTRSELNIVYMKYFEGLDDLEVAKRLGLQLDQVKGKIKSPIVENYICDVVLPYKQRQRISKIKALLADSIKPWIY